MHPLVLALRGKVQILKWVQGGRNILQVVRERVTPIAKRSKGYGSVCQIQLDPVRHVNILDIEYAFFTNNN